MRELVFGPAAPFVRFLGLTVAAFHLERGSLPVTHAATIYEETNRMAMVYPLDDEWLDATFILRTSEPHIPHDKRVAFLRDHLSEGGWILPELVRAIPSKDLYFDGATQIAMPDWHRGRAVLIGDACGCLTLLAGQGSHMAMADAFVLAEELQQQGDHHAAFAAYQRRLKPHVDSKRRSAARWAGVFVPGARSRPWLRRLALKLLFSRTLIRPAFRSFGSRSVLKA